ncbi:MAG: response regulator [Anaerolinea sp.]|nr:response regulator [Anaerolinea sp.]MCC6976192.1 response regulator [Anaerolineae bacterium]CAG1005771.1 Transcriptional regulatory protein WalR [Anaerolineae bacterium]
MTGTPTKIVCIEDDPKTVELVKLILKKEGYDVTGVNNGHDGLKVVDEVKPNLVLLDLMMPDIDGWEVYQSMRAAESTKDIPVIVLTAKAQSIDRVLGLHIAKVNDYITKPFSPSELIQAVRRVLGEPRRESSGG